MFRLVLLTAVGVVAAGCVTQQTFDALKGERDGLEQTLTDKNKAFAELEVKHHRREDQVRELEQALSLEQMKVVDLLARIDKLSGDIANVTKDKSKLQASVDDMTKALAELERRRAESEARVQEFKNLLTRFKSLIDAGKLKVRIADGRMVVVLATDILFGSGSASLSKEGKSAVAEVAQVLSSIPKRLFQVEGHTDNVPIATERYPSNWELAAARAVGVAKALIEGGLPAERVSAASFGEHRPLGVNDTPEAKAANRRIAIIIVPDLSTLPGFEELQKADAAGR